MAELLQVPINPATKGPMSIKPSNRWSPGFSVAANALHVSDVADMVSEPGEIAARSSK
jgi:hypothetical protein